MNCIYAINSKRPILATQLLKLTDLFHKTTVRILNDNFDKNWAKNWINFFTGCDENHQMQINSNQHFHILPIIKNGIILGLTLCVPENIDIECLIALNKKIVLYDGKNIDDIVLNPDFDQETRNLFNSIIEPLFTSGKYWRSYTPYVSDNYGLRQNGLVKIFNKIFIKDGIDTEVVKLDQIYVPKELFIKDLKRGSHYPKISHLFFLEIELSNPISGLLSLGYSNNFGLGIFKNIEKLPNYSN